MTSSESDSSESSDLAINSRTGELVVVQEYCILGCGERVDKHDPTTWKQVIGLVGGPKKDSMRLREDTGFYAHDECVKKLQSGQAVDQPSIFESDTLVVQTWTPKEPIEDLFEPSDDDKAEADDEQPWHTRVVPGGIGPSDVRSDGGDIPF